MMGVVPFYFQAFFGYMQWILLAILNAVEEDPPKPVSFAKTAELPELPFEDCIPIPIPDIMVAYKTRPPPSDQEFLDAWGAEPERVSTVKKEVYIIRSPTFEQAKAILGFSGLMDSYRSTNTTITAQSLLVYMDLISRISQGLIGLEALSTERMAFLVESGFTYTQGVTQPPQDEDMEGGELFEPVDERLAFTGERSSDVLCVVKDSTIGVPKPWGSGEKFLDARRAGIFCPFEINYAAPDPFVIARFIQRFFWLFTEDTGSDGDSKDIEDIQRVWTTEICNTLTGHYLAHLMVSMLLAADCGGYVFALQLPERHYDGSVIVRDAGKASIRGAGISPVHSVDFATLEKEMQDFGFHTVTLRKVLDLAGATAVSVEMVTSMRHLREIVFAGTGMPDGVTRNKISRLLPKLAFTERPLGVNETSLDKVLRLLAHPDDQIPRDLYLATGSFFVEDVNRVQLILAAWGDKPPTFNYGGTPLMATGIKGKGAGAKIKDYDSKPPLVLQMKRVPMQAAITGWNTLLTSGYIWGEYSRKLPGGRSFNGPEKTRVWNILAKYVGDAVVPKGQAMDVDISTIAGPSGSKRGAADEALGDSRAVTKKKRLLK